MDAECGGKCQLTPSVITPVKLIKTIQALPEPEQIGRVVTFETQFLGLLGSEVDRAASFIPELKKRRKGLSTYIQAVFYRLVGRYYEALSRHRQAILWTQKAWHLFREKNDQDREIQCLLMLLSSSMFLGKYQEADRWAALLFRYSEGNPTVRFKTHVNLGNALQRQHKYRQALRHFKQASAIERESIPDSLLGILFYNLGNTQAKLNDFGEAQESYRHALTVFEAMDAKLYQAYVFQAMSYLTAVLGQYFQAEDYIHQALETYQQCGDTIGAAYCLLEEFQHKLFFKQAHTMLDHAESALEAFGGAGLQYEKGKLLFLLAEAMAEKDIDLAFDYLKRSRDVFQKEHNQLFLAKCLFLEANLRKGRGQSVGNRIQKAIGIFKTHKAYVHELNCLVALYTQQGRSLSKPDRRRLRFLLKKGLDHSSHVLALQVLAEDCYRYGKKKQAISYLLEAVTLVEEARASIPEQADRVGFFHDHTPIYETLVQWLCETKGQDTARWAFNLMEFSRSRLFYEQLGKEGPVKTDDTSILRLHSLHSREIQLKRQLGLLRSKGEGQATQILETQQELATVQQKVANEMDDLRNRERLGMFFPFKLAPEDFQSFLKHDEMVVAYFSSGNRIFRFQLTQDELALFAQDVPSDFEKRLNQFLRLMQAGMVMKAEQIESHNRELSRILRPTIPKKIRHLYMVPHKKLQRFPFSSLEYRGKPLVDKVTVSVCPNLPTLLFSLQKEPSLLRKALFFFSNDSEDPSAPERNFLFESYPQAKLFNRFSKPETLEIFSQSDFIHFAGHCHVDPQDPEYSYLQLSGEKVFLHEIRHVALNRPFINLASCGSGFHLTGQGNEPRGFVSTLLAQGATTILSTLWEIDDHTAGQWMNSFYEHLHLGPAMAHRMACCEMRNNGLHAYHWAGFQLTGKVW